MNPDPPRPCCAPGAACGPTRRELLAYSGTGATSWLLGRTPLGDDDVFPIQADKGFSAEWRRALFARGEASVARGRELRWIGMPVGGIGCGQLYLGGDGRLWHWDIFNQPPPEGFDPGPGPHYARPLEPKGPFPLAFTLAIERRGGGAQLALGPSGFPEIEFAGTYPIGTVRYTSADPALSVELEAFSPFVPTELEDSSLPATLLTFRVTNQGSEELRLTLRGSLDNFVCHFSDDWSGDFVRKTSAARAAGGSWIVHRAEPPASGAERPDILFEDFERDDYANWSVAGTAFGAGPSAAARMPAYQGTVGAEGARLVNSHNVRAGEDVAGGDAHVGVLTSRPFPIERAWITFLIGGGAHPGETCVELVVDDEVVATATGANDNKLTPHSFFVGSLEGQIARLRIADRARGGWGNIGVDSIVFSDHARSTPLAERADFGTLALGLLGGEAELVLPREDTLDESAADESALTRAHVLRRMLLAPGASGTAVFALAWHFPNPARERLSFLEGIETKKRHYAARFADAGAVLAYLAEHHERLSAATRLWRDTWYDSSLPWWFLERTFLNVSTLATATVLRFDDGRFYGWEGVYCCAGTCTHVWQYAHAAARLFPALEREQRERVDLGLAFHADSGQIDYRAEAARELFVDGQAGTVLRVWREHLCAADGSFLERVYPRAKKALECLLARDPDQNGILDGAQFNTLDAAWFGEIPWLSSLYLAAVRAGEAMALERGDAEFAARCGALLAAGAKALVTRCFDGEAFVQRVDPAHPEANATGAGCSIDQVLGQSWAFQANLGRVLPEQETRAALAALYRYNFAPDVGVYRKYMESRIPGGRWYALRGEAGLLMCTWPKGGSELAVGKGSDAWAAGYFNECMTGFEHQVAAHMLWEGLVEEGLALERAIHERYSPAKRNPYNEVECGDHYARAMASYGVFLAACGFELHGPKGHLGFAPRLTPEKFRAAFTAPEGWGSWSQTIDALTNLSARLELRYGRLHLASLRIGHGGKGAASRTKVTLGDKQVQFTIEAEPAAILVRFEPPLQLRAGDVLAFEGRG
ncbi:MAG: hypothetical protein EXS08_07355 [Planctomycetes bacterium]|nr:hypothetical protein [Planctomycetota bacterium]